MNGIFTRMICSISLSVCFAHIAHAQTYVTPRSVSVTGVAEAKLAPDQVIISVTVHSEHKQLAAAKAEQDAKVKRLMAILKDQKVPEADVRTLYASVQPQYDYVANSKPRFRSYSLDNQVQVTLKQVETAGPLMDKLVASEFDRIGGLQFGLQHQREAQEKLTTEALLNAREKAGKMASALGAKLGKPLTITESGSYTPPMPMMARGVMAASADVMESKSMPSYSPAGIIEIQQTVNVSFELE